MENENLYKIDKLALVEEKTQRASEALAIIEKQSEGSPVAFLKANYDNLKIRERKSDIDFRMMLGLALTKICALSGIKSQVSQFDGEDINKMILNAYNDLTLEEIYKAFELERYRVYEEKTGHFDLFNADYVGAVLKKYKNWKQSTKQHHNISPPQSIPEMTESQKIEIVNKGIIRVFDEFKSTGEMPEPNNYIFDELHERGLIKGGETPELQAYYQKRFVQAGEEVKAELSVEGKTFSKLERRAISDEIQKVVSGTSDKVIARTKKIILSEYFKKLMDNGQHISEILK